MNPIAQYFIGIALVSFGLCYAAWIRIRPLRLRQDIYDLRDELFDEALAAGALTDPGYRQLRLQLNSWARSAAMISFPSLVYLLVTLDDDLPTPIPSERPEVQAILERTYDRLARRLIRYVAFETLPGLIVLATLVPLWVVRVTFIARIAHRISEIVQQNAADSMRQASPAYSVVH